MNACFGPATDAPDEGIGERESAGRRLKHMSAGRRAHLPLGPWRREIASEAAPAPSRVRGPGKEVR
jgi:hypothetical protein